VELPVLIEETAQNLLPISKNNFREVGNLNMAFLFVEKWGKMRFLKILWKYCVKVMHFIFRAKQLFSGEL
jgi:hypothetical protein